MQGDAGAPCLSSGQDDGVAVQLCVSPTVKSFIEKNCKDLSSSIIVLFII